MSGKNAAEDLILASASPRRRDLLAQLGLGFAAVPADIDETPLPGEAPGDYVARMARCKGDAVSRLPGYEGRLVLSADTAVVLAGQIFGKPHDEQHCHAMLGALSGRSHQVLSAVCLLRSGRVKVRVVGTLVTFRHLTKTEISDYWRTGEPQDKAGGYAIQGLGASFVTGICGSRSNVIGLPLAEVISLMAEFDLVPPNAGRVDLN